jgi:anti-sigma regulatory factor (Ser/Thr protein kinase)
MAGEDNSDTMSDTERLWLVERDYGDESLVELVYATPDGSRNLVKHFSSQLLRAKEITAAIDVDPGKIEPVEDDATRERYAAEAERVRDSHDPDETI